MSRTTRGPKKAKATKSETETSIQRVEWLEFPSKGQTKATNIETETSLQRAATRGPNHTKTRKSETEASQQRVERLEVLSKTKQDLKSKSNV